MTYWTFLLAVETAKEEGGKLFDLDATLPLMAVQFLILAAILNAIFYKPLTNVIEQREALIRNNQKDAKERLQKAQVLTREYEQQLGDARRQAQSIIAEAEAQAQKISAEQLAAAGREAQAIREQAQKDIDRQKQEALRALEQQVDVLSRQILEKILGSELASR